MHTYAIGDIHGQLGLLQQQHALIARDMGRHGPAPVVHIGDLVDRGPNSAGVVEYLRLGLANGLDWVMLKGNHDRMFTRYLDDPFAPEPGLRSELSYLHPKIGGGTTLASYGIANAADRPIPPVHAEAVAKVPALHRAFLQALPTQYQRGECLFVHAGIRPGVPFADQDETDLLWIRNDFLLDPFDHGALIVHGHTALQRATHYGNRLNIDSGAAYGGPLSAVVIEGRAAYLLTDAGRERLAPGLA